MLQHSAGLWPIVLQFFAISSDPHARSQFLFETWTVTDAALYKLLTPTVLLQVDGA